MFVALSKMEKGGRNSRGKKNPTIGTNGNKVVDSLDRNLSRGGFRVRGHSTREKGKVGKFIKKKEEKKLATPFQSRCPYKTKQGVRKSEEEESRHSQGNNLLGFNRWAGREQSYLD